MEKSSCRNPFQGGMGFFTTEVKLGELEEPARVAIPFRVGWGFSPKAMAKRVQVSPLDSRNPFQGGMGFFTPSEGVEPASCPRGRNPFQGGMGFFTRR